MLFTKNFDVEWTNNRADRALRMVKLRMAGSVCWRRVESAGWHRTARPCLGTARHHGIDLVEALRDAFNGAPWMPSLPRTPRDALNSYACASIG
ncbi:hypothetical protein [Streptomyces iranensis]|uniref:Transposase n=1 Tax=Streptomyces iranensis TaxID=576784 RepID=A0A060ZVF0_9ACTN|nr:hypothetical protein [Streptomyces iranensis]MBP2064939.1 transposase [Streptomyces iranensis]CDR10115.1 predicted protein [Streptomyces iranensis]